MAAVATLTGTGAGTSGQEFVGAVSEWVTRTQARAAAVLQDAAFEFAEAIIIGNRWSTGTPVDTGYARASWVASLGARSFALPVGPRPAAGSVRRYVADMSRIASAIAGFGPQNPVLWIANNTAYLGFLEFGLTVPKNGATPPGWIAQAERQWPTIFAASVRKIRGAVAGGARL